MSTGTPVAVLLEAAGLQSMDTRRETCDSSSPSQRRQREFHSAANPITHIVDRSAAEPSWLSRSFPSSYR